jgi:photosystem II protein PsbQ
LFLVVLLICLYCTPVLADSADFTSIYAARLQQVSQRLEILKGYVDQQNWVTIRTYIHGPLGEIRRDIAYLSMGLRGTAKQQSQKIGKTIAADLVQLDFAAKDFNPEQTQTAYKRVKADFDQLLQLLPNPN